MSSKTVVLSPVQRLTKTAPPVATLVRMACRRVTRHYDWALRDLGLTIGQLDILIALDQAPGPSQGQLAKQLDIERSALARALQPLERAGFIASGAGRDRRSVKVVLTRRGQIALGQGLVLARRAHARLMDSIDRPVLLSLESLLERLLARTAQPR